nr:hypothetical transcript [Hymenolepis microstoma]
MCFLKPCAPYARCTNTDTEEGRICYCNGGSGPECYQVPDPCEPSPCQNNGECSKTGPHLDQFVCECKSPWYGPTCQQRYSACADAMTTEEACLNGGVCQDDPNEFAFTCICPIGWKGDRCEDKDYTAAILTPIIVIIIVIIIAIPLLFLWRKRRQSTNTRPTIFVPHREQPVMSANGPRAPQDALAISNDIYGVKYSQVHEVQFLSEEDEYSMVHDNPPPRPVRKSFEGAIRYASLLWDKTAKSVRSSKNKEETSPSDAPSLPSRTDEITTPLIG